MQLCGLCVAAERWGAWKLHLIAAGCLDSGESVAQAAVGFHDSTDTFHEVATRAHLNSFSCLEQQRFSPAVAAD
jgi:hypothetical protein